MLNQIMNADGCIGKTIKGMVVIEDDYAVAFTDGTFCLFHATSSGWDGDYPEVEIDHILEMSNVIGRSDIAKEARELGIITAEDEAKYIAEKEQQSKRSNLELENRERREFARLKEKFENEVK